MAIRNSPVIIHIKLSGNGRRISFRRRFGAFSISFVLRRPRKSRTHALSCSTPEKSAVECVCLQQYNPPSSRHLRLLLPRCSFCPSSRRKTSQCKHARINQGGYTGQKQPSRVAGIRAASRENQWPRVHHETRWRRSPKALTFFSLSAPQPAVTTQLVSPCLSRLFFFFWFESGRLVEPLVTRRWLMSPKERRYGG